MQKRLLLLLPILVASYSLTVAQTASGIPLNTWILNSDRLPCDNSDAAVTVRYINLSTNQAEFSENFAVTTNERGQFGLDLGTGTPNGGVFDPIYLNNLKYKLELDIVVDCDGEQITVEGQSATTPRVPVADAWGPAPAPEEMPSAEGPGWKEFITGPFGWVLPVMVMDENGIAGTELVDPVSLRDDITADDLCGFEAFGPFSIDSILEIATNHIGQPIVVADRYGNTYLVTEKFLIPAKTSDGQFRLLYDERFTRNELDEGQQLLTYSPAMTPQDPGNPVIYTNDPTLESVTAAHTLRFSGGLYGLPCGFLVSLADSEDDDFNETQDIYRLGDELDNVAICAENPDGRSGIFALGAETGSRSVGLTGSFSVSNNTSGNGAGGYDVVANQPQKNAFAYATLSDGNGLTAAEGVHAIAAFGDGFITGNFDQPSDGRLKESIRTYQSGLNTVRALTPRTYTYRTGTDYGFPHGVQHGFVAQEVMDVVPELVSTIKLPKSRDRIRGTLEGSVEYLALNYTEFIPILTGAIQELSEIIADQQQEINMLKNAIAEIKND